MDPNFPMEIVRMKTKKGVFYWADGRHYKDSETSRLKMLEDDPLLVTCQRCELTREYDLKDCPGCYGKKQKPQTKPTPRAPYEDGLFSSRILGAATRGVEPTRRGYDVTIEEMFRVCN